MNTKTLAIVAVFAALTVALNLAGPKIPAPYSPFLFYELWEIPIVVVFFIFGPKASVLISLLNTLILLVVFPGALPTGPFYNMIAVLSMLLGIYIPYKIITRGCLMAKIGNFMMEHKKGLIISTTFLGIVSRVAITTLANYVLLQQNPPIGFGFPQAEVIAFLPLGVLFNATLALYTIPAGLLLTILITSRAGGLNNCDLY